MNPPLYKPRPERCPQFSPRGLLAFVVGIGPLLGITARGLIAETERRARKEREFDDLMTEIKNIPNPFHDNGPIAYPEPTACPVIVRSPNLPNEPDKP